MSVLSNQSYASPKVNIYRPSQDIGTAQQAMEIVPMGLNGVTINPTQTVYNIGVAYFADSLNNFSVKGALRFIQNNPSVPALTNVSIYLTTNADGSPNPAFQSTKLTGITLGTAVTNINLYGLMLSGVEDNIVYLGMTISPVVDTYYATFQPVNWSVPVSGQWTVGYGSYSYQSSSSGSVLCIGT
jgi:hypothetical protein